MSKQPHLKYAAVKLEKAEGALPAPDESKHADPAAGHEGVRKGRTHLADAIGRLLASEERLVRD